MLVACDQIADLKRASEWCRVVIEFTERHNYPPLYAWCRSIYAGVLVATREWTRAERSCRQALGESPVPHVEHGDRVLRVRASSCRGADPQELDGLVITNTSTTSTPWTSS